ncbi:host attachment protein [Paraglaciecola polaris]|uniref:Protein required for attachment to host cells n=1 Tax=Paraglaciecola polaris LMG 21857 TaxID=1129793 RepID=K6YJC8_9ALTE|nr:host attachment protein [Paraglaciecola polaris]GAC32809.1 hypothetical protein GPLA_1902 [Paraglaciecola polaris LMG 21857]|tara:strand:- start:1721 stop:2236 length:516 start_codon:yes stop_codon:yes gene_type:complete
MLPRSQSKSTRAANTASTSSSAKKWVLIANGAQATVCEYQHIFESLQVVEQLSHTHEASRDLVTTERGRAVNSASGGRSAFERPTDPHDHEKHIFATEIVSFLQKNTDNFLSLIIIASPKTLGELRHLLPKTLIHKVIAEVDKDLTNVRTHALPNTLRKLLVDELYPGTSH